MGSEKTAKHPEVKKHVATIHCSNTLSLLQRKISNALLYHAYADLLVKEEHQITVNRLCQIIGYHGNNHAAIKNALKGLIATVIEWNVIDADTQEEDWTASSALASVNIKGPLCHFSYSPRMRQLLHSPAVYAKINLIIQSRFKSNYGLALYENCVRYKDLPHTRWFEIDIFRKMMGVPEDKYVIFRDFKRRVLDKSIEEVNTYSDLKVTAELKRKGNQVASLRFLLKNRDKKQRIGLTKMPMNEDLPALREFNLSQTQIQQLSQQYTADEIQAKIHYIKLTNSFKQGKITNLGAYLMKALRDDFQTQQTSGELLQKKPQKLAETAHFRVKEKTADDSLMDQYQIYEKAFIDQKIQQLDTNLQQQMLEEFSQTLLNNQDHYALHKLKTTGLKHIAVQSLLRQFIRRQHPELLDDMQDFLMFKREQGATV